MTQLEYSRPTIDLSAPVEFARRAGTPETSLPGYRSEFMRDRDRVMYSSAFRRLAGKTQIYLAGTDDHQRNRLTHTLEVSQIARTISSALNLNCDLTEAIALGHDIGHTPFGHAGEQILHEIMVPGSSINIKNSPMSAYSKVDNDTKDLFGFKHNIQGIRIATTLEKSYGKWGLNLTNYTLWGILHHSSIDYKEGRVNTIVLTPGYWREYKNFLMIQGDDKTTEAWSFEGFVVA